ncbi:MAG: hypothetical protein E4G96_08260 [Chrysiogenales bacterium]|nr:MAG: hypothetical protein E4G96_08260 [Chrysiogenales bacterium]
MHDIVDLHGVVFSRADNGNQCGDAMTKKHRYRIGGVAEAMIVKKVATMAVFIRCPAGISPASKGYPLVTGDLEGHGIGDLMDIKVATVHDASKYERRLTDIPSSVSIITFREIRDHKRRRVPDFRSIQISSGWATSSCNATMEGE